MRLTLVLVLVLFSATVLSAQGRQVAVTFDDVPAVAVASCTPGSALALNHRLLQAIERNHMPAAALVTAGRRRCGSADLPAIVTAWLAAGHEIGSHTFTHPDINSVDLQDYLADIDSAHARLTAMLAPRGVRLRYFRHPFLHTGATRARRDAVASHLRGKGYDVAVVTIDNQEWVFADAYARAKARHDDARIARIVPAYLAHIDSSFAYYEALTARVVGRPLPQILLLHANELNADHLDEVARVIRGRGYEFVSLRTALQDPAYRRADEYVGPRGLSWLQRWAMQQGVRYGAEPREPAWLVDR